MRTIIAGMLTVGSLMFAAPAQAVSVEHVATYERAASTEWHWTSPHLIRVWYTRAETEWYYRKVIQGMTAAGIAAYVCEAIKIKTAERACRAVIAITTADMIINIRQAHDRKRCLILNFHVLKGPANGINGYDDRGGKRCK